MEDRPGRTRSTDSRPPGIFLANVGLLATLLAFLTVALRALAVARLDPTTAVALVQTSGPVDVFVGTLTRAVPAVLITSCFVFLCWRRLSSGESLWGQASTYVALSAVGVILLFVGPWFGLPALIGLAVWVQTIVGPTAALRTRFAAIGVALPIVLSFLVVSGVWLPQERLELTGRGTVFGYVLEEEGRWVSILEDRDREILYVERGEIESRQACARAEPLVAPSIGDLLADLFGDSLPKPDYPPCE